MGCTSSRQIGHHDASTPPSRSINISSGANAGGATPENPSSSSQAIVNQGDTPSPRPNSSATAADGRPNQPLRTPSPVLTSPAQLKLRPWTHSELRRQRDAFFDTRVTGSSEVWAALKLVCDMLCSGDIAGAQGMLDATDLTCPTGRIVGERQTTRNGHVGKKGGVYDDKGVLYDVPGWVVVDPEDVVEEQEEENEKYAAMGGDLGESRIEEQAEAQDIDIGEIVKVKARLSGREMDVVVSVGMEQKVGVLVGTIKEKANVDKLRLVHLGKMLCENEKLSQVGWTPGHVLNGFVFE